MDSGEVQNHRETRNKKKIIIRIRHKDVSINIYYKNNEYRTPGRTGKWIRKQQLGCYGFMWDTTLGRTNHDIDVGTFTPLMNRDTGNKGEIAPLINKRCAPLLTDFTTISDVHNN